MATRATTLWSLDTVRDWLRKGETLPTTLDARIEQIADAASEFLEAETGWKFVTRTLTEIYNGDGSRLLFLRNGPIDSITSLTILRDEDDASPETIASSAFHVDKERRLLRLKTHKDAVDPFTRGFQNVTAVYVVGYGAQDSADLPADIVRAGLDLVKFGWTKYMSDGVAASQVTIGPGNLFFREDLPIEIQGVISRWRLPVVA